jgi:ribosome recycling factor
MPDMILMELEESMESRIETLRHDLAKVRTGRANPKMFADVYVDYYGAPTPLNQVGSISSPEPTQLVVKPYDKSIVKDVEKAINAANLGVNPSNEGDQLRIVLPALNTERRRELTKQVKKYGEEAKISVRNYRRDANDKIKHLEKEEGLAEDSAKGSYEDIQELTNKFVALVDKHVEDKDQEIMSI